MPAQSDFKDRPMLSRTLFGEEHELFRDQARRFLEEEVIPHHAGWEADGIVPRAVWRKAGVRPFLKPSAAAAARVCIVPC
jgi:acyl-CoA dehydrogenase